MIATEDGVDKENVQQKIIENLQMQVEKLLQENDGKDEQIQQINLKAQTKFKKLKAQAVSKVQVYKEESDKLKDRIAELEQQNGESVEGVDMDSFRVRAEELEIMNNNIEQQLLHSSQENELMNNRIMELIEENRQLGERSVGGDVGGRISEKDGEIERLTVEKANLENDFKGLLSTVEQLKLERQSLTSKVEGMEIMIQKCEEERSSGELVNEEFARLSEENESLQKECVESKETIESLEKSVLERNSAIELLRTSGVEPMEMEASRLECEKLREQCGYSKERISSLELALNEQKAIVDKLEAANDTQEHVSSLRSECDEYKEKISSLEATLNERDSLIRNLECSDHISGEVEKLRFECDSLREKNIESRETIDWLEKSLNEKDATLVENKTGMNGLEQRNEMMVAKCAELESFLLQEREKSSNLCNLLQEKETAVEELQREKNLESSEAMMESLKRERDDCLSEIENIRRANLELKEGLAKSSEKKEELEKAESAICSLETKVSEYEISVNSLKGEIQSLKNSNISLCTENEELRGEVSSLKDTQKFSAGSSAQASGSNTPGEGNVPGVNAAETDKKLVELKLKYAKLLKLHKEAKHQLAELKKEKSALPSESGIQLSEEEAIALKSKNVELEKEVSVLKDQLEENAFIVEEFEGLKEDSVKLSKELKRTVSENETLHSQVENLQLSLSRSEQLLRESEARHDKLSVEHRSSLQSLNESEVSHRAELSELKDTNELLEKERSRLELEIQEASAVSDNGTREMVEKVKEMELRIQNLKDERAEECKAWLDKFEKMEIAAKEKGSELAVMGGKVEELEELLSRAEEEEQRKEKSYQCTISELQDSSQVQEMELKELRSLVDKKEKLLEEKNILLEKAQGEVEAARTFENEKLELRSQVEELSEMNRVAEAMQEAKSEEISKLKNSLAQVENAKSDIEKQVESLQTSLDTSFSSKEETDGKINDVLRENQELSIRLEALKSVEEKCQSQLEIISQLKYKIKTSEIVENELRMQLAEHVNLKQDSDYREKERGEMETKIGELKLTIEELQNAKQKAETDVEEFRITHEDMNETIQELRSELFATKERLTSSTADFESKDKAIQNLEGIVDSLNLEIGCLKGEQELVPDKVREAVENAKESVWSESKAQIESLRKDVDMKNRELQQMQQHSAELSSKLKKLSIQSNEAISSGVGNEQQLLDIQKMKEELASQEKRRIEAENALAELEKRRYYDEHNTGSVSDTEMYSQSVFGISLTERGDLESGQEEESLIPEERSFVKQFNRRNAKIHGGKVLRWLNRQSILLGQYLKMNPAWRLIGLVYLGFVHMLLLIIIL